MKRSKACRARVRVLLLALVLLLPLVPLAPPAAATVCTQSSFTVGHVTVTVTYNRPGPPGPYTCLTTVTITSCPWVGDGPCAFVSVPPRLP